MGQGLGAPTLIAAATHEALAWPPFLAAIVGAGIGGALAFAGGFLASRAEVRRSARVKLYRDLLPPMFAKTATTATRFAMTDVDEIRREALIAGRKDYELACALIGHLGSVVALQATDHPKLSTATPEGSQKYMAALLALEDALGSLNDHVVGRLRWRAKEQ